MLVDFLGREEGSAESEVGGGDDEYVDVGEEMGWN